jgi:integrase/recombinase XerD
METQRAAFLQYLREVKHYAQNTIAAYDNDLSQFIRFADTWGQAPIKQWSDISVELVNAYIASLSEAQYASSTITRKVATIKSLLNYLNSPATRRNPLSKQLSKLRVVKQQPKSLTPDEVERLLHVPAQHGVNSPRTLRDCALLAVLYATGMRVTEAVTLDVSDLHLDEGYLICAEDGRQARRIPIDQGVVALLRRYLSEARPRLIRHAEATALFVNHRGKRLTRQGLWLIIKAHAEAAGLGSKVTPHTLRHSFAMHRLQQGAELREIQHLLGHASPSTTQVYTRYSTTAENQARPHGIIGGSKQLPIQQETG